MRRSVFGKWLWDQRRNIAAWAFAIAAVGTVYAAFFPSMSNPDMAAAMEAFPPQLMAALGMTDITSAAGYLGSTTYGILGPVLSIIFATGMGARAVAGEEEAGRLDLLLAHPVQRWSVVVQRSATMLFALVVAGLALFVAMLAISGPAQLDEISPAHFAAATGQLMLMAFLFGMLALAVGAATGSQGLALGVVAVFAIGSYFANTLAPTVDGLEWLQKLSPFYYYSGGVPLTNGFQAADSAVLAGASLVAGAIAVIGLTRRDVAV